MKLIARDQLGYNYIMMDCTPDPSQINLLQPQEREGRIAINVRVCIEVERAIVTCPAPTGLSCSELHKFTSYCLANLRKGNKRFTDGKIYPMVQVRANLTKLFEFKHPSELSDAVYYIRK
jgi:hypothetical protein